MKSAFATNMIKARKYLNLTQEQAAEKIGISLKSLQSYEHDTCCAPLLVFVKIIQAYSIHDVVSFVTGEYQVEKKSVPQSAVINAIFNY